MRRFIIRFVLFCLLQVAVGSMIFPAAPSARRIGYLASFEDKLALLEQDSPPRIIIVGGSNAAFGVYSPLFVEAFDRPVVNIGLHGGAGLDFYLCVVRQHVREGDLVVLLPEYALLSDRDLTPVYARNLLRQCPQAAPYLLDDLPELKPFFDQMALSELAYWTQKGTQMQRHNWKRWWRERRLEPEHRSMRARREARQRLLAEERLRLRSRMPYTRFSFNEYGDVVGHHGEKPARFEDRPLPLNGKSAGFRQAAKKLNRFAHFCRRKGASVVLAYAPVTEANYEKWKPRYEAFHRDLSASLEFPVIGRPEDAAFPTSDFFDSQNHLAKAGQLKRTRVLVAGLNRHRLAANAVTAPLQR